VYHIIRVYSCRNFNVNKVDNSTVGPVSVIEADVENHSSTTEVTAAQTNDLVTQFKTDTVSLSSDIFDNMDTLYVHFNFT